MITLARLIDSFETHLKGRQMAPKTGGVPDPALPVAPSVRQRLSQIAADRLAAEAEIAELSDLTDEQLIQKSEVQLLRLSVQT